LKYQVIHIIQNL